jgi:hypothetical protein
MAQLTGDQIIAIRTDQTYIDRIAEVLIQKAEYWKELTTPNRADVNIRTQKRKRFALTLLNTTAVNESKVTAARYWITYYEVNNPVLDANGIPTYTEIFNSFDSTFDFCAGVNTGDDLQTEIYW